MSWNNVQEFIAGLNAKTGKNYRLPTEAEWEFAARGGNERKGYSHSGGDNLEEVGWCYSNSDNKMHPVGTKKANELGIYDMSGNAAEWCQDWYAPYTSSEQHNPTGPSSDKARICRGEHYNSSSYISSRGYMSPGARGWGNGFRLALSD